METRHDPTSKRLPLTPSQSESIQSPSSTLSLQMDLCGKQGADAGSGITQNSLLARFVAFNPAETLPQSTLDSRSTSSADFDQDYTPEQELPSLATAPRSECVRHLVNVLPTWETGATTRLLANAHYSRRVTIDGRVAAAATCSNPIATSQAPPNVEAAYERPAARSSSTLEALLPTSHVSSLAQVMLPSTHAPHRTTAVRREKMNAAVEEVAKCLPSTRGCEHLLDAVLREPTKAAYSSLRLVVMLVRDSTHGIGGVPQRETADPTEGTQPLTQSLASAPMRAMVSFASAVGAVNHPWIAHALSSSRSPRASVPAVSINGFGVLHVLLRASADPNAVVMNQPVVPRSIGSTPRISGSDSLNDSGSSCQTQHLHQGNRVALPRNASATHDGIPSATGVRHRCSHDGMHSSKNTTRGAKPVSSSTPDWPTVAQLAAATLANSMSTIPSRVSDDLLDRTHLALGRANVERIVWFVCAKAALHAWTELVDEGPLSASAMRTADEDLEVLQNIDREWEKYVARASGGSNGAPGDAILSPAVRQDAFSSSLEKNPTFPWATIYPQATDMAEGLREDWLVRDVSAPGWRHVRNKNIAGEKQRPLHAHSRYPDRQHHMDATSAQRGLRAGFATRRTHERADRLSSTDRFDCAPERKSRRRRVADRLASSLDFSSTRRLFARAEREWLQSMPSNVMQQRQLVEDTVGFVPHYMERIEDSRIRRALFLSLLDIVVATRHELPAHIRALMCYVIAKHACNTKLAAHFAYIAHRFGASPTQLLRVTDEKCYAEALKPKPPPPATIELNARRNLAAPVSAVLQDEYDVDDSCDPQARSSDSHGYVSEARPAETPHHVSESDISLYAIFTDVDRAALRLAHCAKSTPMRVLPDDIDAIQEVLDRVTTAEAVAVVGFALLLQRWTSVYNTAPLEPAVQVFTNSCLGERLNLSSPQ